MSKRDSHKLRRVPVVFKVAVIVVIATGAIATRRRVLQPVTIEWEPRGGPSRSIVWAVALDPTDPAIIYAGTNGGGIYKSTDNGGNWVAKNDGLESWMGRQTGVERALDIRDILISRTQPGTMYVATWGPEGIYRSDNDGETWLPQFLDVSGHEDDMVFADESVYTRVLAETEDGIFAGTYGGVFRLVDPVDGVWRPTDLKGEGMSIRALTVDPHSSRTLYAATFGHGIYKSQDGGQTWQERNHGLESEAALAVNALILDVAKPGVVYAGTFGDGVYRSLDDGESWEPWSEGLPEGADVWSLCFAADGTIFAGLRYGGTYKRVQAGEWQRDDLPYGALEMEMNPQTGALYAGTWGSGLHRAEKGPDQSWQDLGLPKDYLRLETAVFAGSDPVTLYAGTDSDGIYSSQDGGQSWERRSEGLGGKALAVWSLAVSSDGHTLYAGTGNGVFVSANGGKQWNPLGEDTQPADGFSVISLAVDKNKHGKSIVYAGTREGLRIFDSSRQSWDAPREFLVRAPERTVERVLVPSLLAGDRAVYASAWGLGLYRGSGAERRWLSVGLAPKYVEALALADRTWLRRGRQFYALTEQGLYGSYDGQQWHPLYPGSVKTVAVDPLHPEVAYTSLLASPLTTRLGITRPLTITPGTDLDSASLITFTEILTSTERLTSTATLASVNSGRTWQDAGHIPDRITRLVRDPSDPRRIFALGADRGLYRGQVYLPALWRKVAVWWLGGFALVIGLVTPYGYFNLLRTYDLSHRVAWGLLTHFWLLLRIRSQRFQNLLKPMEKLILASMDCPQFGLVEVWERLDEIGVSTSRSRLVLALKSLVGYGLLREQDGDFRYATPSLQIVAAVEFRESEDALLEDVRRENRLLSDVERFFEVAGFDVRQDAPQNLTKFVLRPRRPPYQDYDQYHAWLRTQGSLQGTDVNTICEETIQRYTKSDTGVAPDESPVAFAIVTEMPEVEAFRQLRVCQEQMRLIPLSITAVRSALRERSAMRDLDMLVQQADGRADLYDIRAPILDRLDFFGRQDEIDGLKEILGKGGSVDIWSLPGMGKTSLLWHLRGTLVNPIVAYADLEYCWQGERLFHDQIIADLGSDLWLKYNRFHNEGADSFEERLFYVAQAVPARGKREVKIVLLLDGFSTSAGDREQQRILEHLRHLADAHADLALVVAWQDPEMTVDARELLGGLGKKESEQLITTIGARMGLEFSQGSLGAIYRQTGGHPLLLRQLGSAIARQALDLSPDEFCQVEPAWVDRALPHYRSVRDSYFEDVWHWCSSDQREGLRAFSTISEEEKEHLLEVNPCLRALMQPGDVLGDLFIAWLAAAAGENRL